MKKILLILLLFSPLFYLFTKLFVFKDVIDPIKYIYTITGFSGMTLLFITITLSLIKNRVNLIKYRKTVGLIGFFYAFLHFINFILLDAQLDFAFIIKESFEKPFIYLGLIALLILSFMAISSTKKLFKRFNVWHKLIYLALILITIHFVMAQKSLSLLEIISLIIIIIISYFKLLQQIINKNNF